MYGILVIHWKRVLIGRHHKPIRRIKERRQLIERNKSLPLVRTRPAIYWNVTRVPAADRQQACRLVPDIPLSIGINEVLSRARVSLQRRAKLLPILRPVHVEKRELISAWLTSRPAQRKHAIILGVVDRTMARHHNILRHRLPALDDNDLAFHAHGLDFALELRARASDLFLVEILDVEPQIRHTPGNILVVADDDARHTRQRDAFHVQPRRR